MDAPSFPFPARLAVAVAVLALPLVAAMGADAPPRIVEAGARGPAHVDRPVALQVVARAGTGVRVAFPDLRGGFAEACRLGPPPRAGAAAARPARFAVPCRPDFAGSHLLEVAVTGAGGAGRRGAPSRASVPLLVSAAPPAAAAAAAGAVASRAASSRRGCTATRCARTCSTRRSGAPAWRCSASSRTRSRAPAPPSRSSSPATASA